MKKGFFLPLFFSLISSPAFAARSSKIDLDTTGVDWQDKIISLFQSLINLIGGPGVLLIAFVCIVALVCLYVFFPKNAAFPYVFRISCGILVLFNVALIISWASNL